LVLDCTVSTVLVSPVLLSNSSAVWRYAPGTGQSTRTLYLFAHRPAQLVVTIPYCMAGNSKVVRRRNQESPKSIILPVLHGSPDEARNDNFPSPSPGQALILYRRQREGGMEARQKDGTREERREAAAAAQADALLRTTQTSPADWKLSTREGLLDFLLWRGMMASDTLY
jgi:hypothetical protein